MSKRSVKQTDASINVPEKKRKASVRSKFDALKSKIFNDPIGLVKELLFDSNYLFLAIAVLIPLEIAINIFIVKKIPCIRSIYFTVLIIIMIISNFIYINIYIYNIYFFHWFMLRH